MANKDRLRVFVARWDGQGRGEDPWPALEYLKAGAKERMEGGIKRLGALFLKIGAVPMIPVGVGLMLYGLSQILAADRWDEPLPIGVSMVVMGGLLWQLSRRLDAGALQIRYRQQQRKLVQLARRSQGRLTVTDAAADAGMTVEEAEDILKKMCDSGYVEIEVTESGMMVYRFPEVLFAHEKAWSRAIDRA